MPLPIIPVRGGRVSRAASIVASIAACRRALKALAIWCALLACHPTHAQSVAPMRSDALPGDAMERCLMQALRDAEAATTVAQLRARCAAAPASPPADVPVTHEPAAAPDAPASVVESRLRRERSLWENRLSLLPHRPNYLLPFAWGNRLGGGAAPGPVQPFEVAFQLSFKMPLMRPLADDRWAVYFAYTGQFWWQAYNSDRSSPFREYNHAPEIFASWPVDVGVAGWTLRLASVGFEHHSNGRAGSTSRSWNRVFADLQLDRPGGWWLAVRPWVRVPERNRDAADSADGDDNPSITRYYGDGELRFGRAGGEWSWSAMLRRSLRSQGKGAAQFDLTTPTGFNPRIRWYLQLFDGYGESLIDYDRRLQRIGFGLQLNDWY